MEATLEEQCSALGGLFQQIIVEIKNGAPLWEDLIVKALKLHSCLRKRQVALAVAARRTNHTATLRSWCGQLPAATFINLPALSAGTGLNYTAMTAFAGYLDAFQKIADAATSARGATKEIGTALTRICLRHRAVESRMKTLTSTIMDRLITPLQEKLEDWKKTVINLDKEHAKEYKKARSELKKKSTDTLRLQKKARKGKAGELAGRVESSLADVTESRSFLEQTETRAVRAALIEHRSRFCLLVDCFQPVVDEEVGLLCEMGHIQEAAEQLAASAAEPSILPAACEELIEGLMAVDRADRTERPLGLKTPPSSPSSLGSRKSSMASISSLSSSSSSAKWQTSVPQLSELCGESDAGMTAPPPPGAAWPNMADKLQFERAASAILTDRPHTISTAYERGHQRTPLSVMTFHGPQSQPSSPGVELQPPRYPPPQPPAPPPRPPIPQRGSSLAAPASPRHNLGRPRGSEGNLGTETQGVYVNMSELAWMAANKAQEMASNLPPPPPELTMPSEREVSSSESSIETSSGYTGQTLPLEDQSSDIYSYSHYGMRKYSMNGPKPPPPIRRTASISCHPSPQQPQQTTNMVTQSEISGSRESLPPPPDFLLENDCRDSTRVADTVRALTALHHTPASPNLPRKLSCARSVSLERRDSVISALASRLSHPLSPRHLRRHSEGVGKASQRLLESLNARLAMQASHHHRPDPAILRASLMEEIKQGTHLKKTRSVNDRSAPKIY